METMANISLLSHILKSEAGAYVRYERTALIGSSYRGLGTTPTSSHIGPFNSIEWVISWRR